MDYRGGKWWTPFLCVLQGLQALLICLLGLKEDIERRYLKTGYQVLAPTFNSHNYLNELTTKPNLTTHALIPASGPNPDASPAKSSAQTKKDQQ